MSTLFEPYQLGPYRLSNRLVMAPMTRNRAAADGVPGELAATYYAQRASAGLIVTEGIQPSAVGQGYPGTPGLHTDAQQAGWSGVAAGVHARGGVIFAQLMHAGRISHPDLIGSQPVAPSAVRPAGEVFTPSGLQPFQTPRALGAAELPGVVAEFVAAARRAVAAGLDGVELHAANGYLLQQFLADNTNQRSDNYGGSASARARFVLEVSAAVAAAIGPERVGIRISPGGEFNDIAETTTAATYRALLDGLRPLSLAYLHLVADPAGELAASLRPEFPQPVIINTGFAGRSDRATAETVLAAGQGDLFSIGRAFLANPDLVERLRRGAPLNDPDEATFYQGGRRGYVDYPALAELRRPA